MLFRIRGTKPGDFPTILALADASTREDARQHTVAFNLDWVQREGDSLMRGQAGYR